VTAVTAVTPSIYSESANGNVYKGMHIIYNDIYMLEVFIYKKKHRIGEYNRCHSCHSCHSCHRLKKNHDIQLSKSSLSSILSSFMFIPIATLFNIPSTLFLSNLTRGISPNVLENLSLDTESTPFSSHQSL